MALTLNQKYTNITDMLHSTSFSGSVIKILIWFLNKAQGDSRKIIYNQQKSSKKNAFRSNVVPVSLPAFSYCLPCFQAVKMSTAVEPGAAQSGTEQPTCWDEHWPNTAERSCFQHRSGPVPTQPPQRLVFPLTPKQEEEGGVVEIL